MASNVNATQVTTETDSHAFNMIALTMTVTKMPPVYRIRLSLTIYASVKRDILVMENLAIRETVIKITNVRRMRNVSPELVFSVNAKMVTK